MPTWTTRRRLLTLAHELNRGEHSVVCLQEAQAHAYANLLIQACTQYSHSGYEPFVYAPKGGLLTLARLPIEQREFALYRPRTVVSPLALMDWALHKGVLLTRVSVAQVPVVVLNTHLNANYRANWSANNHYARVEHGQLQQLAEIVRAQPPAALVVAAGDFNIPRGSWLYDEFLAASGMVDPLAGDTRPTHRMPAGIPAHFAKPIDFALLRLPALPGLSVKSDHCFTQQLPLVGGRHGYLSDHVGIELRVAWDDATNT
ncbi:MAG: endonuclease/exonuclease/phosphatase family protein [Chloroflexales bacterium]|nr:endonuclease/exonuclease/phosphatase family protein [Chloroflexales bacterium]